MFAYTELHKATAAATDPLDTLVPWMSFVRPNVVLNKDGSVMAAFEYSGIDIEGHEQYEIDQVSAVIEQASLSFREGFTVWSVVNRTRNFTYPGGTPPSAVGEYINDAWKAQVESFSQLQNRYFLFVALDAPKGSNAFLDRLWAFQKEEGLPFGKAFVAALQAHLTKRNQFAYEASRMDQQLTTLEDAISNFMSGATTITLKRLELDSYLSALFARCNPPYAGAMQKRVEYQPDLFLNSYLTAHSVSRPDMRTLAFNGVKDSYCSALSVKSWPQSTRPGMFDALLCVPGEIVLSQAFRFTAKAESEAYISTMQRFHDNAKKSVMQHLRERVSDAEAADPTAGDEGRILLAADAAAAQAEITALGRVFGYHNLTVLCYGDTPTEAQNVAKEAYRALADKNIVAISEQEGLLSAWAGTMPGQWAATQRWLMISNANFADIMPLRMVKTGDPIGKHLTNHAGPGIVRVEPAPCVTVFPTRYQTPFYLNFHQGDVAHTLVVGPTGTGKSIFVNFLLSQFQKYQPSRTIIFDKNLSCRNATLLQDGVYINVGADQGEVSAPIKLNPLSRLSEMRERTFVRDWLPTLLTRSGEPPLTTDDMNSIWDAVQSMQGLEKPRLSSLSNQLPSRLSARLADWIGDGPLAHYYDNEEDEFTLDKFTGFEMGRLLDNDRVAASFLDYAFHRIEASLDGTPTLIYLEEAKFLLDNPQFATRLDEWLRTFRKLNTFVVMATQSLNELQDSKLFTTIIDSMQNKIFLPNANAFANERLYVDKFGLNASQLNTIRIAVPKRNYLIVQPGISRLVEMPLPQSVINCLRSDTKANKIFDSHYARRDRNPDWQADFIAEMERS